MNRNPKGTERLRGAMKAAQARIARNAKQGLFVSMGRSPLTKSEKDHRRALAQKLADELGELAVSKEVETLQFSRLSAIQARLKNLGLVISGPELQELSTAYFAARSEFAV
jgi:hypothetical protein